MESTRAVFNHEYGLVADGGCGVQFLHHLFPSPDA